MPPARFELSSTPSDGPALRYYRRTAGRWSGRLRFAVTDWRGLAAASGARKLLVGPLSVLARFGTMTMSTTLEAVGDDFRHTTRVSKAGATLFETCETFQLAGDGRSVRLAGAQRTPLGAPERYEATGEVDEDATGAVYRVPWMGTDLVQRTRLVPDGLELTQETPWSRAAVLLVRTSPGAPGGAPRGSALR